MSPEANGEERHFSKYLSEGARFAIDMAEEEARWRGEAEVEIPHLLLSLLSQEDPRLTLLWG